ncbi:MAG TPA: metalloregulator ArsR/SmtB family transcription factor [Thermodesulfobacteriota bacterium]|nr:metalloregulator ArsR/SmtB family transcription factor [Thermodesulfobacteriota bacterium]
MRLKNCAKLLKSLAEDVRLQILRCLFNGEYSVSEIAKRVGKKHSQVSHHLGILRNSGIVVDKKEGKFVIYQIHPLLYKRLRSVKHKDVLDFECCSIGFRRFRSKGKVELCTLFLRSYIRLD